MEYNVDIWYRDPISYLIDVNFVTEFIPNSEMKTEEQLNAIFRFSIYLSILVFLFKNDFRIFYLPIFVGLMTFVLYKYDSENNQKAKVMEELNIVVDKNTKEYCSKPTNNNPFMNVLQSDYEDFPNKPPACNVSKSSVKKDIVQKFEENYNRQDDDIFRTGGSERQFYTTPITTIPNDQESFAKWLYTPNLKFKKNLHNN
jgi:hypothetical protein